MSKEKVKVKVGVIGYGLRGTVLVEQSIIFMEDVEICGVCDGYEDRAEAAAKFVEEKTGTRPFCTTDYRKILELDIDAVIISASWEAHVDLAVEAMKAGKYVGLEVGGAYCVEDCWRLVYTSEETGMPCMMLENACYGERELMTLNMVKKGVFGEVVYCEGGYCHDLREQIVNGEENRHYRLRNYRYCNRDNYPTHELGPIAKVLNINNGNRMLSLTSMASKARGLQEYARNKKGDEHKLAHTIFNQGDVVKTTIKCANGEMISLTLDTSLPRAYSRMYTVRGTKGCYCEDNDSVYIDGKDNEFEEKPREMWNTAEKYAEEYKHPLWKDFTPKGGHNGLDWLVLSAFFEAVKKQTQTPIDVYDTASWMVISILSEQSIAMGGAVQAIPDFTRGYWTHRKDIPELQYGLDKIND